MILSCGSNNVENHPLSSRWVERAQDKGATWIVVDPRFTRSAKNADLYSPIRPGTDIAFYGGLISYILENHLYQEEYVLNYTNAACILRKDFKLIPTRGSSPAGIRRRRSIPTRPGATTSITSRSGTPPPRANTPG